MKQNYHIIGLTAGQMLRGALYKFEPRVKPGENPWEGKGESITTQGVGTPITDKSYWEGRYALCVLTLEKEDGARLTLDNAVVSVSQQKQIVSTQVVGRRGTVKEYISDGDYSVNISVGIQPIKNGSIVDEYPSDGVQELRKFLTEAETLKVQSAFLDLWNISGIVVKSFNATQATDTNIQVVEISAESDEDYNIYSTEY